MIEEQLRADLQDLRATGLDLGIDVDAVVGAGHREVTRRAVRWAAGGAAGALTLGVLAYGALSANTLRAVPEPAQATVSVPATLDGTDSVALTLGDEDGSVAVAVGITRTGERIDLDATLTDENGTRSSTMGERRLGLPVGDALLPLGDELYLGVLGGLAEWVEPQDSNNVQWIARNVAPSRPLGVSVYVLRVSADHLTTLTELFWRDQQGLVRRSTDEVLASTRFDLNGVSGDFFIDDREGVVQIRSDQLLGSSGPLETGPRFVLGDHTNGVKDGWLRLGWGLLPPGASQPEVALADPSLEWTSLPLGERTLVLVAGTTPGEDDPLATSITFTDGTGEAVTQQLG
jgi:hypothetical protein